MIPILLGAAILLGGAVVAATWWDEIRSTVYCWLQDHGYLRTAKAFLVIEGKVSGGLRMVKAMVFPTPESEPVVLTEQMISEDELSPEARARRERQIYEMEMNE